VSKSVAPLCEIPQASNKMHLELMFTLMDSEYTNLNLILCLVFVF